MEKETNEIFHGQIHKCFFADTFATVNRIMSAKTSNLYSHRITEMQPRASTSTSTVTQNSNQELSIQDLVKRDGTYLYFHPRDSVMHIVVFNVGYDAVVLSKLEYLCVAVAQISKTQLQYMTRHFRLITSAIYGKTF